MQTRVWGAPRLSENAAMEVEAAVTLLVGILSKRGIEIARKQLIKLVKLGLRLRHFKETALLFSFTEWQELGNTMWERTITGDAKEEKEIKTVWELWQTVIKTLKAMKAEMCCMCRCTNDGPQSQAST